MTDFRLSTLKPRYEQLFAGCMLRRSWLDRIASVAQEIINRRSLYAQVEAQTTVPWWFVGIVHYRDASFRDVHLHNGDPLTGRTINPPTGRPIALPANGYSYTWVESAIDALREKTFDTAQDRSIAAWLWRFEMWNGFEYAQHGINSEYLWNGTNHYGSPPHQGKFVTKQLFDANAISEQIGAAALLWYLYHKELINLQTQPDLATATLTNTASRVLTTVQPLANGNTSTASATVTQPATFSTATLPASTPIQLLDVFNYYRNLPHQDSALIWLQQQLPQDLLTEFAHRWQHFNSVAAPLQAQPVAQPIVAATQTVREETSLAPLNQAILDAALKLKGMNTSAGPERGNKACAWTFNRVLESAGIKTLGANPNLVSSLRQDLEGGRGRRVSRDEALAGDLVFAPGDAHIGVGLEPGCRRVLSNSSSRAKFVWESNIDFDGSYRGQSTIYRLLK